MLGTLLICGLLLTAIAGVTWWTLIAFRVQRTLRDRPTVRKGLEILAEHGAESSSRDVADDGMSSDKGRSSTPGLPKVSVIVPAHNEERLIETCIGSLRQQEYESLELIFVLDRCTDGTAEILRRHAAEDPRVVIIENETCPDDWSGKCHAAALGAEHATGAYLLFTDADTVFHPELVRASVALARDRGIGLLSLLSNLTMGHAFEWIAQPVASMTLLQIYPIERVNRTGPSRPFANGQFMLFDRREYDRVGGHFAVKDALLEDIAFARRLGEIGGQGGIFLADGMLTCAMYDSFADFKLGWKRIFIEACKRKPRRVRKYALRLLTVGVLVPLLQLVALVAGLVVLPSQPLMGGAMAALVLLGVTIQALTLMRIYRVGGTPRRAVVFFPLGCLLVGGLMLEAARDLAHRRPIPWAGKQYVLQPRY